MTLASVRVARLCPEDVPAASAIEAVSMARPWPARELLRDVADNSKATYLGAYAVAHPAAGRDGEAAEELVGFVGAWQMVDESHITTIAVRPDWRRRGVARSLLLHLVLGALREGARFVTLEVRRSNVAAQRLYAGLGFREVGMRKAYYADNGEDALILTTPTSSDPAWLAELERVRRHAFPLAEARP